MVKEWVMGEIVAAAARGWTVLTGTREAARWIGREVEGSRGTAPPNVSTWGGWIAGLWHGALLRGATDRMLLNRTQEEAVWRGLIEQDAEVATLQCPEALARLAAEAWRGLAQYRGLARLEGSATNGDTATFARLAAAFDAHCRTQGLLTEGRLETALRQMVRDRAVVVNDTGLLLVGMERMTPAQGALVNAVREAGVRVEMAAHEPAAGLAGLVAAESEAEEMLAAVAGCRDYLVQHPSARTAILVPELGQKPGEIAEIDRLLREVLAPETSGIMGGGAPFEISGGMPLGAVAGVADALDVLEWASGPLALERVSHFLVSCSVAGGGERAARAEFDAYELRQALLLRPEVSVDWLLGKVARSGRRERLVRLMECLRGMQGVMRRAVEPVESRAWGQWAEVMREVLTAAGWEDTADGATRQEMRRAWESVLDEMATLDFDGSRGSYKQALAAVRGIVADTTLHAKAGEAAVQAMRPEECPGMRFDAVWCVGMGDRGWPAAVGASPLLAWPLRRELGMPGSDRGAERAQARRMLERIAGCAARVVFSYAREVDGEAQRRSGLLDGLVGEEEVAEAGGARTGPLVELERVEDGSRIPPPPDRPISGGAAVLQAQAACGFRAFAEWRLFAKGLEPRDAGMNAKERGTAVHRVLERFWEIVETQAALRGMSREEREARLRECVAETMQRAAAEAQTAWDGAYLAVERERLVRLVGRWLEVEAGRAIPFTVVQREIDARDVAIGPLRLALRVDRVDRTAQGAVLIDYKTGRSAEPAGWLGERPDEPQLPLYAVLAVEDDLHAVAFGRVCAGTAMALTGFADAEGTLSKVTKHAPESLGEQREAWFEVLTGLATDFWNGDTRVSPKTYPGTCEYCAQRLICRLDVESAGGAGEDEEAMAGGDRVG